MKGNHITVEVGFGVGFAVIGVGVIVGVVVAIGLVGLVCVYCPATLRRASYNQEVFQKHHNLKTVGASKCTH